MEGRSIDSRIAATLLALAGLAERVALRSFPVRFLVLAILWRAEKIARAYVSRELACCEPDLSGPEWACLDLAGQEWLGQRWADQGFRGTGDESVLAGSTIDAALLALRLRMLASIVMALAGAAADDPFADWPVVAAARTHADLPVFFVVSLPVRMRLPAAHDTS